MARKSEKGYIGMVKLGPKGQIVIPKEVREMFGVDVGDSLVLLADAKQGIALQKPNILTGIASAIFSGKGKELYPEHDEGDTQVFAEAINEVIEEGVEEKEDDDNGSN